MAAVESSIRSRPEADQKTRLDGWGRTRGGRWRMGSRQPFIRYYVIPFICSHRWFGVCRFVSTMVVALVLPTKKRSRTLSQPACGDLGDPGSNGG